MKSEALKAKENLICTDGWTCSSLANSGLLVSVDLQYPDQSFYAQGEGVRKTIIIRDAERIIDSQQSASRFLPSLRDRESKWKGSGSRSRAAIGVAP